MTYIRDDIIKQIFDATCKIENMDNKFGKSLSEKENHIRKFILSQTPVFGFILQIKELLVNFNNFNKNELNNILLKFNELDIIHLSDDNSVISAAYPFSNVKTKHIINFKGNHFKQVYAMCAIDALGIPFMFNTDLKIYSECFYSNEKIEIVITNKLIDSVTPEETMVWYDMELSCCAAENQCSKLNFFSSIENFEKWKKLNESRNGYLLNLYEALYLGERFFKNRLN